MRTLILILFIISCGFLAGCKHGLFTDGRELWIHEQIRELQAFKPGKDTPSLKYEKTSDCEVRILGCNGLVRLADGEWFYFKMCSSHETRPDIIMAIDSKGRLYANNGHICPDLILAWPQDRPPKNPMTLADFANSWVSLQTGRKGASSWIRVDEWKEDR